MHSDTWKESEEEPFSLRMFSLSCKAYKKDIYERLVSGKVTNNQVDGGRISYLVLV